MTTDTLTEDLSDWSARLAIDPQTRMVCNVALTGPDSKNGYRYSEIALREAAPLYDQKPVFLDHAPDRLKPRDRSTRDLVGNIVNPRFEDGRVRGDIRVLDTESGRTFLALTHTNLPGVGMSHVVLAQRSSDGSTVESIRDVVCVDAVINPATTLTFREHQISPEQDVDQLTEQRNHLRFECDQLREQLNTLQARSLAAELQLEIHQLLNESQLPPNAVSPLFRQQLEQAPTNEVRRELLRDRMTLVEQSIPRSPQSRDRVTGPSVSTTPHREFVAAIRSRTA
ncbi:MAG: hypothetical protein DWH91_16325 [Planctomycetota bacterium]|nr:MAG: hypothetical protein DWH91_16325 [Planctomycetota bacterium]